jgi:hypothetical protein
LLYIVIAAACCLEALYQKNPICWCLLGLHIASEILIVDIIYVYGRCKSYSEPVSREWNLDLICLGLVADILLHMLK